jgi:hypothetical protein
MTHIYPSTRSIRVSDLGPANPLPQFRLARFDTRPEVAHPSLSAEESAGVFAWGSHPILPYLLLDGYDRSQAEGEFPVIRVENESLRLIVYPQAGGRLASMFDTAAGCELLHDNPAFQPANLAVLNAWFSGGVEWNGIIPGHSPFTCAPVFAGRVESDRGPILRLYEFERIREAAWQVDLYLPPGEGRLWVHGRLLNPNPHSIAAYWWTNIAAPLLPGSRVLAQADHCIEHVLPDGHLEAMSFPAAHGFDGSYPEHYGYAASVFFRPERPRLRPWLAALREDGSGLLHVSTASLPGRKLFVFGSHRGGRRWMDFLSLPGRGAYIEVQAGARPTQDQEFVIPAGAAFEWTECLGHIGVERAIAHQGDFAAACHAADELARAAVPQERLLEMDAWLHARVDAPVTEVLHRGAAWGLLHERLTGNPLAPGLDFAAPIAAEQPWAELAETGTFSAASLGRAPESWAVSPLWVSRLEESKARQGVTWLHELFLGVARLNEGQVDAAREHFSASLALHDNYLAHRCLAQIAQLRDDERDQATDDYLSAYALSGDLAPLAVEICQFCQQTGQFALLEEFLTRLPDDVRRHERIALARGRVALQRGDYATLREVLQGRFATIREGETLLTELWFGLHEGEAQARLGRPLTEEERQEVIDANPMPYELDFRMLR